MFKKKLKENYNFNAFSLSLNDQQILFKIKKINILQSEFININLKEFLSDDNKILDLINFLVEIKEEDLNIVLNNQELLNNFFNIVFNQTNVNINFLDILKTKLKELTTVKNSTLNLFIKFLLENNYKLIEINKLSNFELIDTCLKTAYLLNNLEFFEMLLLIVEDEEDEEIKKLIKDFIGTNKKKKAPSAFDQLSEL